MEKKSFLMYTDMLPQVLMLSDAQAGIVLKSIFLYAKNGEELVSDDLAVTIMFSFIRQGIDRDTVKYRAVCEQRSEAGKKGGAKKKANASAPQAKQANASAAQAKQADNDNVNVNVNENVNDNVNVYESVPVPDACGAPSAGADTHTDRQQRKEGSLEEAANASPLETFEQITGRMPTAAEVLDAAEALGYHWDRFEAEKFLRYNQIHERRDQWRAAMERWESKRFQASRAQPYRRRKNAPPADDPLEDMYLSLVNMSLDLPRGEK